jgi:hypothetical protein
MKPLALILVAFLMAVIAGCATRHSASEGKNRMLMDSSYLEEKDITVIRSNAPIRVVESMKNFEDNPNITQADIDAEKRIENREVQYVNKESKIKISEEAPVNKK